ncbi:MAG: RDD family protein [Blastopirellula sp. JB062]
MSTSENPFRSPAMEATAVQADLQNDEPTKIVTAPQGRRLANYVVDFICVQFLVQIASMCLGVLVGVYAAIIQDESIFEIFNELVMLLFSLSLAFFYFFLMEGMFGRTLGKLASGTKVIDELGNPPTWGQAAGRSLCRFIPFEPFSFFGSGQIRGWHDSIPKTYVVKINQDPA